MSELTPQERVLDYLRTLEKPRALAWLMLIVTTTEDGAKISAPELAKLYDTLGYDGRRRPVIHVR